MGFPAGFIGGFALTSSILYLSISVHRRNRLEQSMALSQQSLILRTTVEALPPSPPKEIREDHVSIVDQAKDRWNSELITLVRKAQETDWSEVGEGVFERVSSLWGKSVEGIKSTAVQVEQRAVAQAASKREG